MLREIPVKRDCFRCGRVETQMAVGAWRRAVIVFEDGNGVEIRNKGAEKLAVA